jgi:hypothetical protein
MDTALTIEAHLGRSLALDWEDEKMRFTLGLTGLYERFAGRIFSASEAAHGKPAPRPLPLRGQMT